MSSENTKFSAAQLLDILAMSPNATAVYTTVSLLIQTANDAMIGFWGKDRSIIGLPLEKAVPELQGQPFIGILKDVWNNATTYHARDTPAELKVDGKLQIFYFDFTYRALVNDKGEVYCILHTAEDVTERYLHRLALTESRKREIDLQWEQEQLNEELSNVNAELKAALTELMPVNKSLAQSKDSLEESVGRLQKAEERLRFAVEGANAGTWFLDVETQELTSSDRLRQLFGYRSDENMSYTDAIARIDEDYRDDVVAAISRAIDKREDYSIEYPVTGYHDQKQRWLKAFGKMDQEAWEHLHFSGLVLDITQQKLDEIRKNDFIGMVSHELKTPLTGLKGYVQLLGLKTRKTGDDFTATSLRKIEVQVNKMYALINGFLNVSRLESGKISLNKEDFDLGELVRTVVDETTASSSSHIIQPACQGAATINADRDKIEVVLSNLISNAMKYSRAGTPIRIDCVQTETSIQVSVKDEGTGICAEDLKHLFERFYRVENDDNRGIGGFGIGLYLSAEIVQRHQGHIWVESEMGKGSTFHFELPLTNLP